MLSRNRKWGLGDFNTTGYPLEQVRGFVQTRFRRTSCVRHELVFDTTARRENRQKKYVCWALFCPLTGQGFDVFIGQDSQVSCHNWYPSVIQNNTNGSCVLPLNQFPHGDGSYCIAENATKSCTWANDLVTTETVNFLRNHQDQQDSAPFFIYLSTTTPHVGDLVRMVLCCAAWSVARLRTGGLSSIDGTDDRCHELLGWSQIAIPNAV